LVATWKRLGQELRAAGLDVTDVWQVVRLNTPYPAAVPVLLKWARELTDAEPTSERDRLLEGVVRALSVPEARPAAAETLLDLFPRTGGVLQWIIGNAIEVTAAPAHSDRLLDLVEDARWGASRQMLVLAARRVARNNPRTLEIIRRCVDDDAVAPHAMTVLAGLDPHTAVRLIGPKRNHPDPAIAVAALKAYQTATRKIAAA
jgi:hypothetical protein